MPLESYAMAKMFGRSSQEPLHNLPSSAVNQQCDVQGTLLRDVLAFYTSFPRFSGRYVCFSQTPNLIAKNNIFLGVTPKFSQGMTFYLFVLLEPSLYFTAGGETLL